MYEDDGFVELCMEVVTPDIQCPVVYPIQFDIFPVDVTAGKPCIILGSNKHLTVLSYSLHSLFLCVSFSPSHSYSLTHTYTQTLSQNIFWTTKRQLHSDT